MHTIIVSNVETKYHDYGHSRTQTWIQARNYQPAKLKYKAPIALPRALFTRQQDQRSHM